MAARREHVRLARRPARGRRRAGPRRGRGARRARRRRARARRCSTGSGGSSRSTPSPSSTAPTTAGRSTTPPARRCRTSPSGPTARARRRPRARRLGPAVESGGDNRILDAFAREIAASLALEELEAEASEAGILAAAGDLRTAILSAVSHDLRTPLSGIKASVTSLLQEDVEWTPEARHEFLVTIDEESDRLNALVGNLLDMSRLQTGALDVSLSAVGVDEVIPAALASIGARAAEVEVDVDETHPRVLADPGLLERALANVIANALNHSPPGEHVRVVAGAAGDAVDVRIVDRGPGVPADERDRVFLPFQRLGDAGRRRRRGTRPRGRERVRRGDRRRVEIEDTPGGGLTMVFRLRGGDDDADPRRRRRAADPARARHEPEGARLRGRPRTDRRGRAHARGTPPSRSRHPRPRAARDRRDRGDPGAARLDAGADHRALGARGRAGQGGGARRRRRRLRDEAVRDGRAAGAAAGRAATGDARRRERRGRDAGLHRRSRREAGHERARARCA